jgi:hypothetical protein
MRMLSIIICLFLAPLVPANDRCPQAECEEVKQKIRLIQSKMRQGYTLKQGEKMKDELRRLRAMRSKKCR